MHGSLCSMAGKSHWSSFIQISEQQLPFVLKNQQISVEGGTFVIHSLEDLSELKRTLATPNLPSLLSPVTSPNPHLKPATLILSEMNSDSVGDWGLTFFVTRAGECIFLAVTQQGRRLPKSMNRIYGFPRTARQPGSKSSHPACKKLAHSCRFMAVMNLVERTSWRRLPTTTTAMDLRLCVS